KYSAPSTHVAPTPAECGRPSGRTVATKNVRSASGVSLARISRGRLHGSSADPYRSRLRVEIGSVMVLLILVRRTGRPQIDTEPTKIVRPGQTGSPPNPISLPSGSRKVALRTKSLVPGYRRVVVADGDACEQIYGHENMLGPGFAFWARPPTWSHLDVAGWIDSTP